MAHLWHTTSFAIQHGAWPNRIKDIANRAQFTQQLSVIFFVRQLAHYKHTRVFDTRSQERVILSRRKWSWLSCAGQEKGCSLFYAVDRRQGYSDQEELLAGSSRSPPSTCCRATDCRVSFSLRTTHSSILYLQYQLF